ncbi:MAG: hypothetical protein Ct9H300mP25_05600 [Acidobacteriota bacterium]|nr:MAG: hypothetical protein Ct9H300mP25_05600 [Acidobacteriota bacterium]
MYTSGVLYGRRGLFTMALNAVDNPVWDIVGKHAGQPVTQLIGGDTTRSTPALPNWRQHYGGKGPRHSKFLNCPLAWVLNESSDQQRVVDGILAARDELGQDGNLMTDCVSGRHGRMGCPFAEQVPRARVSTLWRNCFHQIMFSAMPH